MPQYQKGGLQLNALHHVRFIKHTFIHIRCVDEDGDPLAGRKYVLRLSDPEETEIEGTLDADGWTERHENLLPGECFFQLVPEEIKRLKLKFVDAERKPFIRKPFELKAGSHTAEGVTDGSGYVVADVPAEAERGEVTIWLDAEKKGESHCWDISISES